MPARDSKYIEMAQQAIAMADEDNAHRDAFRLRCKDNMQLFFFMQCVLITACSLHVESAPAPGEA